MDHRTAWRYEDRKRRIRVGEETGARASNSARRETQIPTTGPLRLKLTRAGDGLRPSIETFIASRYEQAFGSAIVVDYPLLISLHETSGTIVAAVGLRWANGNALFLEQYLACSVESVLSGLYRRRIERRGIVELGSLAAIYSGVTLYLIGTVAAYMARQQFDFALATSTNQLRRLFSVFDFELTSLGPARRDALRDQSSNWGTYYEHTPEVLVGSVQQCLDSVRHCPAIAGNATRTRILEDLFNQVGALA